MATQWYFNVMGKVFGPVSSADLLQRVRCGDITEATPIRKNNSKWFPAKEVGGLFDAAYKDMPKYQTRRAEDEATDDYDL
jgi:hypothetical protein